MAKRWMVVEGEGEETAVSAARRIVSNVIGCATANSDPFFALTGLIIWAIFNKKVLNLQEI